MMKRRWTVSELIRLALIHAESDRRDYCECDPGPDGKEAGELADALHALRLRRYGETRFEKDLRESDIVDARSGVILKRADQRKQQ
jgi:hypothetical protein